MRSEANLRLSECQPLPGFGSSPASVWALFHQTLARTERTHVEGFRGAGSTGASRIPGVFFRASSKTATASAVTGVLCS